MTAAADLATTGALLVEDDPASAKLTALVVRSAGGHVQVVGDGRTAALLLLAGLRPTVVLLDLALPDMSGLELVRFLRACAPLRGLRIIALSASGPGHGEAEALAAGCDDFLRKPVDPDALAVRIAALARRAP
jgi:DNA-binding response OmpR family regulator